MIHKTIKHIHRWRVFFLVGITLVFLLYAQLNPLDIGYFLSVKLGKAIGMSVSIPENPYNKVAMQLKEKEERLNAREAELNQREASLESSVMNSQKKMLGFIAVGIVVLFVLILINFYYDWFRQKRQLKN